MNLQAAMSAQGAMTVSVTNTRTGPSVALAGTQAIITPSIGAALAQTSALESVLIHDRDDFQFYADLRHLIATESFDDQMRWFFNQPSNMPSFFTHLVKYDETSSSYLPFLSWSTSTRLPIEPNQSPIRLALQLSNDTRVMMFHDVELMPSETSRYAFMTRSIVDPTMHITPFQTLARTGTGLAINHTILDDLSVDVSYLQNENRDHHGTKANLGTVSVEYQLTETLMLSLNGGTLEEQQSLLGSSFQGAFGNGSQKGFDSRTMFIGLGTTMNLTDAISLFGHYNQGFTRAGNTPGLIDRWSAIHSDAFGIGINKHALFDDHDDLTFMVSQPLRVRSGHITLNVPVADDPNGNITQGLA